MNHVSLFSGIGGFDLAAEWAGFTTIAMCESERYCQAVLKSHWPDVPIYPDVRTIDGNQWRGTTLLTGGFPCQPFSIAGRRKGTEDDRDLWPEMCRVIQEARPRWVVGENVANFTGMGLDRSITDLEALDYSVGTVVLPACAIKAPHIRQRTFVIAYSDILTVRPWRANSRDVGEKAAKPGQHRAPAIQTTTASLRTDMAHTESNWLEFRAVPDSEGQTSQSGDCPGSGREDQSSMGREAHGVPGWLDGSWELPIPRLSQEKKNRKSRLRALGNALVPQQVYPILALIAQHEQGE